MHQAQKSFLQVALNMHKTPLLSTVPCNSRQYQPVWPPRRKQIWRSCQPQQPQQARPLKHLLGWTRPVLVHLLHLLHDVPQQTSHRTGIQQCLPPRKPSLLCSVLLCQSAGPVSTNFSTLRSASPQSSYMQESLAILTVLQLVLLPSSMYTAQKVPTSPHPSRLSLLVIQERVYTDQRQQLVSLQEAFKGAQPKELCLRTFQLHKA